MVESLKFAITGHTKGLGKELSRHVDYIGFSRSNGHDISTLDGRNNIVIKSNDCNIFLNCAYSGDYSQVDMLYTIFNSWKDKESLIVNIGSETTSGIKNHIWPYSSHKAALDKASEQLSFLNTNCRVTNFKFGYINSTRVIETINPSKYICIEDAAAFILNNINIAFKYRLTEILLRP
jgi:NAD(P)-dependent dehydrogenase (short-subunit alcohol dehydrogenase family)